MEKEKLIIKNFGPIKEVDLDLGRFTILIGEQATGKSTVAKVLAVCRYFSYIIGELGPDPYSFSEGLETWGMKEYINSTSYIFYQCKHYSITVEKIHPSLSEDILFLPKLLDSKLQPISLEFKNLLNEFNKIIPENNNTPKADLAFTWKIPYGFFSADVKNVMDNPFYLPTERGLQSIFSIGRGSIPNLTDFLYNYFSKVDGIAQFFNKETQIEPLDIFYVNQNGIGYVRKEDEHIFHLLSNAASGYQSTIPVVLVMKYYNELKRRRKTFIIEEPELNLFPRAQNKAVQYFVDMSNKYGDNILFTTQSPYTLTSINNMMFAYQTSQIDKTKTASIIDERFWLNPSDVSAYLLKFDEKIEGITAENIMDEEVLQIKAERIDEISRQFNKEYDKMLDIKYPAKNEG